MKDLGERPALPGLRSLLRDGLSLASPFWRSRGERQAWALLAAVVALTLGTVWLNVRFSNWNNRFYDTLQNHDIAGFWHQLGVFSALAAAFILVAVYRQYLQQLLFMRWRTWLTDRLLEGWLATGTAFRVGSAVAGIVDNPDQRIAEDARGFVSSTLDLGLGLLNAGVTLVSFVGILWHLSGTLDLPFASGLHIPGYMVWVAIGYSLLGTWINRCLGRPLAGLNGEQQKVEADFRYALVQVRDNAEAIGLAHGEPRERARLDIAFDAIRANWSALIRTTKRLTGFSAGYGQIAIVFPILASSPRYFTGRLQLGGLMQTAQAFGQVQSASSWFIDAYPRLAEWRATVQRLSGFVAVAERDVLGGGAAAGICHITHPSSAVELSDLVVQASGVPGGHTLAAVAASRIESGDRLLITGPSGSGKSSLVRAIAGLWRHGHGTVRLPAAATLMFVPQRPYLPEGSLREALAYPFEPGEFRPRLLARALFLAGLGGYAGQLDVRRRWSTILSPGEQQRLHFARVLLQRPDWVFLDESTSALDEATESALYGQLHRDCPGMTIVSVGHRSTLKPLHDTTWLLEPAAGPAGKGSSCAVKAIAGRDEQPGVAAYALRPGTQRRRGRRWKRTDSGHDVAARPIRTVKPRRTEDVRRIRRRLHRRASRGRFPAPRRRSGSAPGHPTLCGG